MFIQDKSLAQFFTPRSIAQMMRDWIRVDPYHLVLEPSVGIGGLIEGLDAQIDAFDIDERCIDYCFEKHPKCNYIHRDYLKTDNCVKYDAIISNPPYLKSNQYNIKEVISWFRNNINENIPGNANTYHLFVMKSLYELNSAGKAAFLIPSDWYSAYRSNFFKDFLWNMGGLEHLIIFDNNKLAFDDNMSTACLLLIDKTYKGSPSIRIVKDRNMSLNDILSEDEYISESIPDDYILLSDICKVRRGTVTGVNEWFTGDIEKFSQFNPSTLVKCLVRAGDMNQDAKQSRIFDSSGWTTVPKYLIQPDDSEEYLEYIRYGEEQGYHTKHITQSRKKWYQVNLPRMADAFVNVFSRTNFHMIRNVEKAHSLSCFHYVYFNPEIDRRAIYDFIDSPDFNIAAQKYKKIYGGGLCKLEPGMVSKMRIPGERFR